MSQTVLFVDDDASLLQALVRTLRTRPYRVLTVGDGDQALALLGREAVDVVVSDEQMPGMGGMELLTTVHREYPATVNVMLSGKASIGTVVRALNEGQIFRFLIKPCGTDELSLAIDQALAQKLMLDRCRSLLPLFRRQRLVLQAIERLHPGLISGIVASSGNSGMRPSPAASMAADDLSESIEVEIRQAGVPTGREQG